MIRIKRALSLTGGKSQSLSECSRDHPHSRGAQRYICNKILPRHVVWINNRLHTRMLRLPPDLLK